MVTALTCVGARRGGGNKRLQICLGNTYDGLLISPTVDATSTASRLSRMRAATLSGSRSPRSPVPSTSSSARNVQRKAHF